MEAVSDGKYMIVVAALAFLLYANTTGCGYVWDDRGEKVG